MINRKHRILASLLLCVMLFSVLVVPISHSQKEGNPGKLAALWLALTAALDVLDAIERMIGIITKDLQEMEDAVAEANDELNDVLYPEREKREEEIRAVQQKLDELNSEEAAALSKRSNAESRIRSLTRDIQDAEGDLAMLGPYEYSAREALEHRRARYLSIAGVFVFLAIVFLARVLSPSPPAPEPVKVQTAETAPRRVQRTPSAVLDVSETYYRTIVDSNLFYLIGWTRPRPKPTYRLSGTVIPTDGNKPNWVETSLLNCSQTH